MIRLGRGKWKGHILRPSSRLCRPTSSLVRGAFLDIAGFSLVNHATVWDLCSGTGAVGLETLSWGAAECVFVDNNPLAISFIRSTLRGLGAAADASVLTGDVRKLVPKLDSKPDIVFIDPPYEHQGLYEWIYGIDWKGIISENGMVFAECGTEVILQQDWKMRKYGGTHLMWKTMKETE
ncbi:MAG: RsmD family RNA methyltransferase [Candidatus Aegiribacteria sp.]|nr:RsmD family RNA methyltransferase [Candidatus Aegiribacteria sp.]